MKVLLTLIVLIISPSLYGSEDLVTLGYTGSTCKDFNEGVEIDIKHSSSIKKISPEEKVENSLEDGALEGILGENGFYYFFSILFACIYSFVKMSIDSGGDFDRFLRPVEEFFINFGVILVIHLFFAAPIWVFSKIKFPKISFYTVLIISILSLIGSS